MRGRGCTKRLPGIESGFDPKQHTGSYIGLFQLSKYEFNKFGSGQILPIPATMPLRQPTRSLPKAFCSSG